MSIKKKITDFVRLEQGSIGGKAAMVTGAAMVAVVLAAAVNSGTAKAAGPHADFITHTNTWVYHGSWDTRGPSHLNYNTHTDAWPGTPR